jgi:hypothetical protein
MTRPFIRFPTLEAATTMSARTMMAESSGGPMSKATMAIGTIRNSVMTSLDRSPKTDANNAISSAFLPLPLRANAGPSIVVAIDAPVPGTPIRMAGMLPP